MDTDPGRRRWRRAAAVTVLLVAVLTALAAACAGAVLTVLAADEIPFSDYNIDGIDRFVGVLLAIVVLGVAGVLWIVAALCAWRWRNVRTRLLWAAPIVVLLGAVTVMAVGYFSPQSFSENREEFDRAAEEALAAAPEWRENYGSDRPRSIGGMEIDSIERRPDGTVLFRDADDFALGFTVSGWAYSEDGPPDLETNGRATTIEHLGGNWYSYTWQGD